MLKCVLLLGAVAYLSFFTDFLHAQAVPVTNELEFQFITEEGDEQWKEEFNWEVMACMEIWDLTTGDDFLVGYEVHITFVFEDNPLLDILTISAEPWDENLLPEPQVFAFDNWMSRAEYKQWLTKAGCEG